MVGGLLVIIFTALISFLMIDSLKRKYVFIDASILRWLFFFHLLLAFVYYLYALFNPSDSLGYYSRVIYNYRGDTWSSFYGTSTTFIEFIGYPFLRFFNFSYEAMMALFAFFGFIGYVYFYIFFKENIRFKHSLLGVDYLTIFFFLPNLHFWSSSYGKGPVIFMGIAIFFYGISNLKGRWVAVVIGALITYHVRPHILLVILVSSGLGFMFTTKGVSWGLRITFLAGVAIAFYFIYKDVLSLVGIDEEEFLTQGLDLTHRATDLTKATSGVNITSYSLPMQVFTFLYRPLFFDAPGILGLIVSFENAFYLLLSLRLLTLKGIPYLVTSNFKVKTAFFSFLTVSIALAQISGNLGLAIRQKSQVMMLLLFIILSFLDAEKMKAYRASLIAKARKQRLFNLANQKV